MNLSRGSITLGLAALLAIVPAAYGQQTGPRIGYVSPAGGRQGAAVVVILGGRSLDGCTNAFVSGAGVKAKVVDYLRANRPGDISTLLNKMKKLDQKKTAAAKDAEAKTKRLLGNAWMPDDEILLAAMRRKVANFVGGPTVPAIGENVLVAITIAPDAEPGQREIRLETPKGLTNPLAFCIGQLPEFSKEPNISEDVLAGKITSRYRDEPKLIPPGEPTKISLPAVVNGQVTPGGSDRYQFEARKGQRLVIAASARELIPYISDAVPGWFQATLTLYDGKGRELAYADHYLFHPDPVLYHEVREDGPYVVEIRDSIYRGREDFVYRITAGEVPFVTSIFPLGGQVGTQTPVELAGWNLPTTRLTQDAKDREPGIQPLRVEKEGLFSNALPFAFDTLPELVEKEPNNQPDASQAVTLPAIVNGRVDPPDEWDVFRFEGRKGAEIVAEVYARRLGSPLDSVLKLTDASGKQLALNDDHVDKGAGLTTHHADSYVRATLPTDGTYYLLVGDAQHKGGPEYAYRLRVGPSQPDFELRVVPSSFTVRGTTIPVTAYALRRDGFSGEIALALKDMRDGATLSDGKVPAGEDEVKLTLKLPPMPPGEPVQLSIEGHATIGGHEVARTAVPAEDMMQAFEYRHLVPSQELKVAMVGRFLPKPPVKMLTKTPVRIPVGGTAQVKIGVPWRWYPGKFKIELRTPPAGVSVKTMSPLRDTLELVLQTDPEKVKPGQRGSLVLTVSPEKAAGRDKAKPADQPRLTPPKLPSIPFEIVKR